jgi:hypothetical protein
MKLAEFVHVERATVPPETQLLEEDRASTFQPDRDDDQKESGGEDDEA